MKENAEISKMYILMEKINPNVIENTLGKQHYVLFCKLTPEIFNNFLYLNFLNDW